MSIHRGVDLVLHIVGSPGSIPTRGINESNRKFVQVLQGAGDRLTASKGYADSGFRVFRIQHLFFEFEALVTRCDPRKIAARRMAGRAPPGAVKVPLPGFGVSGLEVGNIHSFTPTLFRGRSILLGVDEGRQAGNLPIRKIKAWHTPLRASITHDSANLVSTHVRSHHLGASQVRTAFSAASVAAMTKGTILPKKGAPALDQCWRVGFGSARGVLLDSARSLRTMSGRLCSGTREAQKQPSRRQ